MLIGVEIVQGGKNHPVAKSRVDVALERSIDIRAGRFHPPAPPQDEEAFHHMRIHVPRINRERVREFLLDAQPGHAVAAAQKPGPADMRLDIGQFRAARGSRAPRQRFLERLGNIAEAFRARFRAKPRIFEPAHRDQRLLGERRLVLGRDRHGFGIGVPRCVIFAVLQLTVGELDQAGFGRAPRPVIADRGVDLGDRGPKGDDRGQSADHPRD